MAFQRATKKRAKLRMALIGPSGSGKTYSALNVAQHLGERVAVIDTERGSASKYAHKFEFDVMEPSSFHPQHYIDGIREAEATGYDVLVIDSLSHAWMGKDGALELVDRAAKRSQSQNSFAAWREVTPLHNALVDAMIQARLHIIVTMRAKTEYVLETNEKGKQTPRKVGLAPVQRDGLEYEFDVVADMDLDNNLIVSKTRCEALAGGVVPKPGKDVADVLNAWLTDGAAPVEPPKAPVNAPANPTPASHPQPPRTGSGEPNGERRQNPDSVISQPQRNRLYAIANEFGWAADEVKALLRRFGYTSSKDILAKDYDAICKALEAGVQDVPPPPSDDDKTSAAVSADAGDANPFT